MPKILVGKVRHFYSKVSVATIALVEELTTGDMVSIEKDGSVVEQKVISIQVEHANVNKASSGDSVGIKTDQQVKEGSDVYKIV